MTPPRFPIYMNTRRIKTTAFVAGFCIGVIFTALFTGASS